jgi:hypothetical protein
MTDVVTTFYLGTVPGTDTTATVDIDVLEERYLAAVVREMGAGATLQRARGAWRASGGALVVEDSIVIETIASIEDDERKEHRKLALRTAQELCRIGQQHEVYVTQRVRDLIVATP